MVVLVITYSGLSSALRMPATVCCQAPALPTIRIVDLWVVRFERDLDVVQSGCDQLLDVSWITQTPAIGVQPGYHTGLLGVLDQLWQVLAQSRLAAGEDQVWDATLP